MDWAEAVGGAITSAVTDEILSKLGGTVAGTGETVIEGLGSVGEFFQNLFR